MASRLGINDRQLLGRESNPQPFHSMFYSCPSPPLVGWREEGYNITTTSCSSRAVFLPRPPSKVPGGSSNLRYILARCNSNNIKTIKNSGVFYIK